MSENFRVAAVLAGVTVGLLTCATGAFAGEYREADVRAAASALSSQDKYERKSAAFRLVEMGPAAASAIPSLIQVVQSDPSPLVRGEAAHALGNIGHAAGEAVPAIIGFLQSEDGGYERTYAATALGCIGERPAQAVPALILAVQSDSEPVVRELAARALGDFGAQAGEAIPVLIEALQTGDKDLRNAAACGLAQIPARSHDVPALVLLLSDEIDVAREAAAKSLGGIGSEAVTAVPGLTVLLTDKNDKVKYAAAEALGKIGREAKPALPELKKALDDPMIHDKAAEAIKLISKARG